MKEHGPWYYDLDGTPIDGTLEWARIFEQRREDGSYRVGDDTLPNGVWISTVWLGLDHGFFEGRPLFFETMVFDLPHTAVVFGREQEVRDELDMARYSTLEQAKRGHLAMVKKWSKLDALESAYKKVPDGR